MTSRWRLELRECPDCRQMALVRTYDRDADDAWTLTTVECRNGCDVDH